MKHTQVGSNHTIEYECECKECKGTGLYVGFAENDGAAVVCERCSGTGKQVNTVKYTEFDKRKVKSGVKRVYLCNPGIGIGEGAKRDGTELVLEDFGGMSYKDWKDGKPFPKGHEMREYTCPTWYYQSADYDKKPDWDECQILGTFSSCKHFGNKDKCWKRWDKEFGK